MVVLYLHSTSNHNSSCLTAEAVVSCLISSFYIKPQLLKPSDNRKWCCLISSFYIKPQPGFGLSSHKKVVLYLHSTSNHNLMKDCNIYIRLSYIFILHQTTTWRTSHRETNMLSYIFILHQTTTRRVLRRAATGCLISSFYIKPQHENINMWAKYSCLISSFYIKPQLSKSFCRLSLCCLISSFYIKPQHLAKLPKALGSCLISSFYIKPQLYKLALFSCRVVLYLHSTSNHNWSFLQFFFFKLSYIFILHQTTTVRPWWSVSSSLSYIFILHQTTTGRLRPFYDDRLSYIFILHQTTTGFVVHDALLRCLISSFYIKPQLMPYRQARL